MVATLPDANRERVNCPAILSSVAAAIPYDVVLYPSEEGFAVQCPALPGCWSQGDSEAEALENIADAIHEYLLAVRERIAGGELRRVEVAV